MENAFIHNFVTPNGVWENIFLHNIDTYLLFFVIRQMLCLYVSVADVIAWKMLYVLLKLWQMLLLRGRCYPQSLRVVDVIANFTVTDVIPLQYVATSYVGWCYCQVADGIATY